MNRWNSIFYLSAVFITYIGNSMIFIAAGKTAYDQFGLASVFGTLLFLEFIKSFFLSGVSGWVVDRYSARGVAVAADLLLFSFELLMAGLAAIGYVSWAVVLITLAVNFVKPFQNTATFSLVRQITSPERLFKLNSRAAAALNAGYLVGLAIAAILLEKVDLPTFLTIDAVTYLASAILFLSCSVGTELKSQEEKSLRSIKALWASYIRLMQNQPDLVYLAQLIGLQLSLTIAYNTLLFKNVAERYTAKDLSLLEGLFTVSYLLVSSLLGMKDRFRLPVRRLWIPFFVQAFCFGVFALPWPLSTIGLAVICFGAMSPIIFASAVTALYEATPDGEQSYVGGLKGSIQALIALPLLVVNNLLVDISGIFSAFIFLSVVNLIGGYVVIRHQTKWGVECTKIS